MAGRPREFDRSEALARARDTFWARGFEPTSMTDLIASTGVASASLYAAFGSKEALFREAITDYEMREGAFAERALNEEPTAYAAVERMLCDAVRLFTRRRKSWGCMVVTSALNCSDQALKTWLSTRRNSRTASIIERLREAVRTGELHPETDAVALGDLYATLLQGLSVQARDGISRNRLMNMVAMAMRIMDAARPIPHRG